MFSCEYNSLGHMSYPVSKAGSVPDTCQLALKKSLRDVVATAAERLVVNADGT